MGKVERLRMVDELLSSIAQGYSNSEYIADKIAPVVTTTKEGGKIPHFTQESFIYDEAERGMGASSNILDYEETQDPITWGLTEYDMSLPIDYRELDESAFDLERAKTLTLTEKMYLRREKKTADKLQNSSLYTNSNTAAVATKWDDYDNSDPTADVEAAMEVVRGNIARRPNTVLIGASTYSTLRNHPQMLARLANTKTAVLTPQLIGEIWDIPNVLIGNAIWVNRTTRVKANVWLDNVILAYVPTGVRDQRSMLTPGFAYTLAKKGWPPIDKWVSADGKVRYVRYTALETPLFHGNIAGYLLRDTNT